MYDLHTADFVTTDRDAVPTGSSYSILTGLDGTVRYYVWKA